MRPLSMFASVLLGGALVLNFGSTSGCGGSAGSGDKNGGSSGGSGSGGSSGGLFGDDEGGTSSGGTVGAQCPSGTQCNVSCGSGGTTSISGIVTDPAGKNPLFDIEVYVPGAALQPLTSGVGSDACDCSALYKSGAVVSTITGVDGSFKLTNAPVGASVPVVVQIGKWRKLLQVKTTQCMDNPQGSISLPSTVAAGDTNDNMPQIAVSTGSADTLECLMRRIGLPTTEYTAGAGGTGHVHVFAGGEAGGKGGGGGGGGGVGKPETPGMAGAPASNLNLWANQGQLMPYDIVLLSCEGAETYDANPPALESYLNAGGRAFASHFHYAFFSGPITSMQAYTAPADWGTNLATWSGDKGGDTDGVIGGIIDQTLNGSTAPFAKGVDLYQWLGLVNALGQNGVAQHELSIYQPRYNAVVGPGNKPSQPWIIADQTSGQSGATMYFSFDTPVNAPPGPNGGPPAYCGRAVFSDLHVAGNPMTMDTGDPPTGCSDGDLSPQEKALEFMLFDLSSCVIPDTVAPPDGGISTLQ
jgi:hypothetical protein